jgi:hypothetical protein
MRLAVEPYVPVIITVVYNHDPFPGFRQAMPHLLRYSAAVTYAEVPKYRQI